MDPRFPAIAEQLLLIERELRLAGWWDDAGAACVLGRVEAACVAAERGR